MRLVDSEEVAGSAAQQPPCRGAQGPQRERERERETRQRRKSSAALLSRHIIEQPLESTAFLLDGCWPGWLEAAGHHTRVWEAAPVSATCC